MDKILLIDGHNNIYRACVKFNFSKPIIGYENYNEVAPQKEIKEVDDSIIFAFNFFRNLRPLIESFSPDKCFFVLEGHPQFRYDLFADYKANRIIKEASKKETNEKFLRAKDIILPLMKHLPITICRAANYEADDVIATLCENLKDENLTVLSNDSDFIQLLQRGYSNVAVYSPIKKNYMVAPEYFYVAWKCLNGDKSDNIPALVKPKKAVELAMYPELFKKFMEVEENRANFNVNRQLIEFRSVPLEEISMVDGKKDFDALKTAFEKLEFESITNQKSWEKYCKTFDCLKY